MKILYPIYLAVMLIMSHTLFAQVPKLNSFPSAAAVIYLDFDGHTVNGTSWNSSGTIYAGPSNLSDEKVIEVFNRIAEDYRPFNINITTDSTKYWAAPVKRRMRALLTITWEWYGRAGGVAFTNSFTWGDNTPCFIFTSLHGYNVKNIAEAASHEIGHTLGLRHQARYDDVCIKTEDYNSGNGSGQVSWAPIMGVGYYRNQTTWHNGPNPFGCTSAQDDLSIITNTTNGFGYRPDDHAATFSAASALAISDKKIAEIGNITTNTDEDMFKVTMPFNGLFKLEVAPYSVSAGEAGSNLDVELKLYNNKQKLIRSYNPTETLSAAIDTTLNSGDYYITVTGAGNMYATDYASLGSYSIQGSVTDVVVLPLRKLELKGTGNGAQHQLSWVIDADEAVVKQVLEVSENGGAFTQAAQVDADSRNTNHYTPAKGAVQYRLNVTFENGKQHYSNIIAIRNGAAGKPQLYTNVISSNALMVSSPSLYSYLITDINGRQMAKGQVTEGSSTINTGNLTAGIYLIRFNNGSEQHVEKFSQR